MICILIVEDDLIVAESLKQELEGLGYQVAAIVKSGEHAVQKITEISCDLVLMDIQLEGKMDGVEAAEQILTLVDIPVVYLTAFADEQTLQRAKITEPFGYILKPFQIGELHSNIEMALYKHETEKKLKESTVRYRRITDAVTDYIYTVTIRNGHPVTTHHREACVAVTGYTSDEFAANPYLWFEMIYDEDKAAVQDLTTAILSGTSFPPPLEHRIIRKDGVLRWVKNTLVPHYDAQGRLLSYDGLVRDITEWKQAQEALEAEHALLAQKVEERTQELRRANAELARAAQLKDEFLANMSHELRTPLNTILGLSEVLEQEIYGSLNPKQIDAVRHIDESGRHLLELINDILDLSKIGARKFELNIGPVAVDSLIQSSVRFVKQLALKKRIDVSWRFNENPLIIHADGRRVKQILVNLLSNSVKFTPKGGKIGLDVQCDTAQDVVFFHVWDTGIGIAREDMEHLFQPFVQLNGTLTRKHEGSGLGLMLVARMVDLHGGSIAVESEVGKGSRFTVSLPLKSLGQALSAPPSILPDTMSSQEELNASPSFIASKNRQPFTILIADDHETSIKPIAEYLMAQGFRILFAHNGIEAVQLAQQEQPAMVVMDIQMPEMDGLEAIQHIRSTEAPHAIPIIALTALAMPGDRERCLAAGADEYFSKPVNLRILRQAIARLLAENVSSTR